MANKIQLPVIGGLRKKITLPQSTATTISGLEGQTVTLQQLYLALKEPSLPNTVATTGGSGGGGGGGGGSISFANPTAEITLSTQNGVALTAMRSDAAPALNVGITPSWTGQHNYTLAPKVGGVAVALVNGVVSHVISSASSIAIVDPTGPTTYIDLAVSPVTPGSYTNTNLTVNAYGIITSASTGSGGGGSLEVTDGTTAVTGVSLIDFSGAVVTSGSSGEAIVTISGGTGAWTQNINESGASLANFTSVVGTWATSGGTINANNPSDSVEGDQWFLKCKTPVGEANEIIECTINVTAWNAGSASRVGFYVCGSYTGGNPQNMGTVAIIQYGGSGTTCSAYFLQPFTAGWGPAGSASFTFALSTNHTLKVVKAGSHCDIFVDGVYIVGTSDANFAYGDVTNYIGLFVAGANVAFSNFKQYTPTLP